MKIWFWLLAIASIPAGLFMSTVSYMSFGLGLSGTVIGEVVCVAGMLSVVVSVACGLLGIAKLRKGDVKRAVALALAGVAYSGIILAGMYVDDAVDTMLMNKSIAENEEQRYGENWNAPPAIEGIPEQYQEVLNKLYVAVGEKWTGDQLMDLGVVAMSDYYGDAPLDNIGFVLVDLNGDRVDELVIGAVAKKDQQGNELFCVYTNPDSPFYAINSVEGEVYYLHAGAGEDDSYEMEIAGTDRAWVIAAAEKANTFDLNVREGTMDPAGRMTVALIPFSQYK